MRIKFKIASSLLASVKADLLRPHPFAYERVGFLACRIGSLLPSGLVIIAGQYNRIDDDDYVPDESVGAMMGPNAIRKALQFAYNRPVCMFHVHQHDHTGQPRFSRIDRRETAKFVPNFWHVRPAMPHGAIILSKDSACGLCWYPKAANPIRVRDFTFVGSRMSLLEA